VRASQTLIVLRCVRESVPLCAELLPFSCVKGVNDRIDEGTPSVFPLRLGPSAQSGPPFSCRLSDRCSSCSEECSPSFIRCFREV